MTSLRKLLGVLVSAVALSWFALPAQAGGDDGDTFIFAMTPATVVPGSQAITAKLTNSDDGDDPIQSFKIIAPSGITIQSATISPGVASQYVTISSGGVSVSNVNVRRNQSIVVTMNATVTATSCSSTALLWSAKAFEHTNYQGDQLSLDRHSTPTTTVTGTCYTVSAASGGNGTITPASRVVLSGATASFNLAAATGYSVGSVSSTCGGTLTGAGSATGTFTTGGVTAACTVTASFTKNNYTVTGSAPGGHGTITPPSQSVPYLSTAQLTLTPDNGYSIVSVTSTCGPSPGGMLSGNTFTTGQVPVGGCSVTASFTPNSYPVSASSGGNGTISPASASVTYGTTTSFALSPASGYASGPVTSTCGPSPGGMLSGNTFMTGPVPVGGCSVTASFTPINYPVTASVTGGGGTIGPTPQSIAYSATTTFTVTPANTYRINSVSGCNGSLSGTTYMTGPVPINGCTVTGSFLQNQLSLSGPTSIAGNTPFNVTVGLNGGPTGVTVNITSPDCGGAGFVVSPTTPQGTDTATYSVTVPATPATRTCTLNASAVNYVSAPPLALTEFVAAVSACDPNAIINDPSFSNGLSPGMPGYSEGSRANNKDTTCGPLNYTYVNGILQNQGVHLTWDTLGQPNAVFKYTVFWKPEFVDPATGFPKRRTRVAWESDLYGITGPVWVFGNACLTRDPPAAYTMLAAAVPDISTSTITVAGGTPPPVPFPIVIDTERMTVTAVSSNTWTVSRGVGGTTAAVHNSAANVMSTPLPIDPNATRPGSTIANPLPNPYLGLVDHMCLYDESFTSVQASSLVGVPNNCTPTSPGYDATNPPACVQRSSSAFDIGDGFMDGGD